MAAHLVGQRRQHGEIAKYNRKFTNMVTWILRMESSCRDLLTDYEVHQRFIRWHRKSIWKKLFEVLKGNKKFEWLRIDSTYVKDNQYSIGAQGGN